MKDDTLTLEPHHIDVARKILEILWPRITGSKEKHVLAVAGESGSGKSTTASAIAQVLTQEQMACVLFQQDDYYMYPPKTNDRRRREDAAWRGTREVNLALLDQHLQAFLNGRHLIDKPSIAYAENRIEHEIIEVQQVNIAIVEGTYVSLLEHPDTRIFLERTYLDSRADRHKRSRDLAELDDFTEGILQNEHEIVAAHKLLADIIITTTSDVVKNPEKRESI